MIGRRSVVAGLAGAVAAPQLAAQQHAVPLICYLALATRQSDAASVAAFRDGLRELGHVEGVAHPGSNVTRLRADEVIQCQQTRRRVVPPDAATDSGRTTASRCQSELRAFTVGGIGQASLYVLAGQIREVNQNLLLRHPRGEVRQDLIDGHSQSADARLAATLSRLNRDDVSIVHGTGAPAGSPSSRRSHYCAVSGRADKAIE